VWYFDVTWGWVFGTSGLFRFAGRASKIDPDRVEQRPEFGKRRRPPMRAKIEQLKKKGQGLVEYALILVLIAIVVILILTFLGNQVNTTFSKIGSGLKG
jgi:pilus assembly protein Flp/PilA